MSAVASRADRTEDFWRGRTSVEGPRATRFHAEHDAYDVAAIRASVDGAEGVRVLDLGSGTCVIASRLVSELGWQVHAVDYVAEFLERAIDDPRLTTAVGDVRYYEDAGDYDLIVSLGVIMYLLAADDRSAMYERCARMLSAGGTLFLKAQFGVEAEVRVDQYSEALNADYCAVYPQLDTEVARISAALGPVAVLDPYPPELNPYPDTHVHYVIARH
ncbi:MAG: class I SAM-dependent methyltransferase [Solirubrobacteraceae bacterium]|jgi:cyclopropane fatty-acyl-phospholipid synthase-like methyltransferase